jgi:hypothetical protein
MTAAENRVFDIEAWLRTVPGQPAGGDSPGIGAALTLIEAGRGLSAVTAGLGV